VRLKCYNCAEREAWGLDVVRTWQHVRISQEGHLHGAVQAVERYAAPDNRRAR
jgi:hypothetical protein